MTTSINQVTKGICSLPLHTLSIVSPIIIQRLTKILNHLYMYVAHEKEESLSIALAAIVYHTAHQPCSLKTPTHAERITNHNLCCTNTSNFYCILSVNCRKFKAMPMKRTQFGRSEYKPIEYPCKLKISWIVNVPTAFAHFWNTNCIFEARVRQIHEPIEMYSVSTVEPFRGYKPTTH